MKRASLVLAVILILSPPSRTQEKPAVLDVWPGKVPGETAKGEEKVDFNPKDKFPVKRVGNVSKPTVTIFRPAKDKDTGAAVLICPGGGYNILAWDLEGEEVAAWLNSIGVTGIVLKYRVPRPPGLGNGKQPIGPLQDAQRAMSLVRSKAKEWNIDAKRIGILGFSAGGHLAASTSTNFDKRAYETIDDVDKVSCRPDFTVLVYPAYLTAKRGPDLVVVVMQRDQALQINSNLDEKIGERIAKIPGVRAVEFGLSDIKDVHKGPDDAGADVLVFIQGCLPGSSMISEFDILSGRQFKEGESGVAMLGVSLAENLGKKVGDTIKMGGKEVLKVIGIYRSKSSRENNVIVLPLRELQRITAKKGRVTGFSVTLQSDDKEKLKAAKEAIEKLTDEKGKSLLAEILANDLLPNYEALAPDIRVGKDSPPTFFAHAANDPVKADNSILMFQALRRAGIAAELHVYATGGHGFGLRPSANPCSTWPQRCGEWMRSQGLLKRP